MSPRRTLLSVLVASLLVLTACASRPVNPPLARFDANTTYTVERQGQRAGQTETLVVLAFSGGGTRAAAFSYGVLETLRRTEVANRSGQKQRLLDSVDIVTGVSGGSFTALSYRLYGERLFDEYERRFLKRNVQGELIGRALNPINWGALGSTGWGRSELAADLYDEILFSGATFADLQRSDGPFVGVSATDITTGSRVMFTQMNFDVMCAELGPIRLARAAAASSAVPVVLSPLTLDSYGGSCGYRLPPWTRLYLDGDEPPRPAARVLKRLAELQELGRGGQPYLHLVDGGVSDNLAMRGVLDVLTLHEALHEAGYPTPLDHVRRVVVFVVNSMSSPSNDWARSEDPPGTASILLKAIGVPIDRYSGEQIEQLKDIEARWKLYRDMRESAAINKIMDPTLAAFVKRAPAAVLYTIDVSFAALKDPAERDYLNELPTTFVLEPAAVDRLRAAAAKIIIESPEFQRLLRDVGAQVVAAPPAP